MGHSCSVQRAADEMGAAVDYIETTAAKDYATNIGLLLRLLMLRCDRYWRWFRAAGELGADATLRLLRITQTTSGCSLSILMLTLLVYPDVDQFQLVRLLMV